MSGGCPVGVQSRGGVVRAGNSGCARRRRAGARRRSWTGSDARARRARGLAAGDGLCLAVAVLEERERRAGDDRRRRPPATPRPSRSCARTSDGGCCPQPDGSACQATRSPSRRRSSRYSDWSRRRVGGAGERDPHDGVVGEPVGPPGELASVEEPSRVRAPRQPSCRAPGRPRATSSPSSGGRRARRSVPARRGLRSRCG